MKRLRRCENAGHQIGRHAGIGDVAEADVRKDPVELGGNTLQAGFIELIKNSFQFMQALTGTGLRA